jgi:hypothetical protein
MGPIRVIVANVFRQQSFQVPLIEPNHVIEQVTAATADPPLGNTILPRTANQSSDCVETKRFNGGFDLEAELCIMIEDEMLISIFVWKRLA